MKKLLSIILVITLTLTLFASCGKTENALTSTELLDLGEKYLLDMDYEQAIVYFNKVIEVEPKNKSAYLGLAEAYVGLNDTESAINTLKTALNVFSDDEEVTIELFEMLIEIDPSTAEWYLSLAQIYINQGNTDKAIEVLQQGLTNASDITEIVALFVQLMNGETVEVETVAETHYGVLNNDMLRSPTYFDKSTITEIDFLDSLETAPTDAWDFSLDGDGSVLGWLDGTHLYVAGDGEVIADEDASALFGEEYGIRLGFEYHIEPYSALQAINFNGYFNTARVKSMRHMFNGCSSLLSLDLSSFNTSNVTYMSDMFQECGSLISLDVSSFNTSNVTNMSGMFMGCGSLATLDLNTFDTSNVTNMRYMFYACEALTSLDLSFFDTSNVTDMRYMFCSCGSLTSLDLSNFNTSNVTDMSLMFFNCSSLTFLDISNFETSNVTDMSRMFSLCKSLTNLDISNFDMNNANTEDMFFGTIFE